MEKTGYIPNKIIMNSSLILKDRSLDDIWIQELLRARRAVKIGSLVFALI